MLTLKKLSSVALLVGVVLATTACKDEKKAEPAPAQSTASAQVDANLAKDPSYAVGVLFGTDIKGLVDAQKDVMNYDQEKVLAGVADALKGKVDLSQNEELISTLKGLDEKLKTASQAKVTEQAAKVKAEGEKFAAEFAKKEGVKKTQSGLLYRIDNEGTGAPIKATDVVKMHYTGKLADGTVFDSSRERNIPAEFAVDQVIQGWTEGLQLVKKGGKIELMIPADLAYGDQDLGTIPANSTLYFDVEVLDVNPKNKN